MSDTIRILGIDPGSQVTGYGLIDVGRKGNATKLVHSGEVKTSGEHR